MAEVDFWERKFIELYILPARRRRYLEFLKGRRHREKVLERLNHTLDFDPEKAVEVPGAGADEDGLYSLLASFHVEGTCHLMGDGNPLDGHELRIDRAVPELLRSHWGIVLICPPRPIALYKEESPGRLLLLADRREDREE